MYKVVWFARFLEGLGREKGGAVGARSTARSAGRCRRYADEEAFLESMRTPEWAGISGTVPHSTSR